jgi:hypothetical protein
MRYSQGPRKVTLIKFIFIFLLAAVLNSAGQTGLKGYRYGFKIGYGAHTVTGSRVKSGPKDAFMMGLWLQLRMNKKWTAQCEIDFVEKGTGGYSHDHPHYGDYWLGLYYFEVPLLMQYHLKKFAFELVRVWRR